MIRSSSTQFVDIYDYVKFLEPTVFLGVILGFMLLKDEQTVSRRGISRAFR